MGFGSLPSTSLFFSSGNPSSPDQSGVLGLNTLSIPTVQSIVQQVTQPSVQQSSDQGGWEYGPFLSDINPVAASRPSVSNVTGDSNPFLTPSSPVASQIINQPQTLNIAQVMSAIRGAGGNTDALQSSALQGLGINAGVADSIAKSIGSTLNLNSINSVLAKNGITTNSTPIWTGLDGSNLNSLIGANAVNPFYMSKQGASIYDYLDKADNGSGYFLPSSIYKPYNNGNGDIYGTRQSINGTALSNSGGNTYTQDGQSGYYFPTLDAFKQTLAGSGYDDKGTLKYYRTGEQQSNDNPFGGGLLGSIGNLVSGIGKATGLSQPLVDANLAGSHSIVPIAAQVGAAIMGQPELSAAISAGRSVSDGAPLDQALLHAGASYGFGQYVVPEIKGLLSNLGADSVSAADAAGAGDYESLSDIMKQYGQEVPDYDYEKYVQDAIDSINSGSLDNAAEYGTGGAEGELGPGLNNESSLTDIMDAYDQSVPSYDYQDYVDSAIKSVAGGAGAASLSPLQAVQGLNLLSKLTGKTPEQIAQQAALANKPNWTGVDYSQLLGLLNGKSSYKSVKGLLGA